ncbi:N-lysine methyltransferase KMT5A-like [Mya arenaria]|uniref:N-lysine methyltransferase KMT5A-like n=1 Tax=Mya arenaria TaxID=6604 RepID=UPI0022E4F1FD|nr:N-lysine methyltransferase KMT5A-like [Mya arenaria]
MPVPGKRKSPKDIALQWVEKGDPDGFSIDMYGFKGRGIKTLIGRDRGELLLHYTGEKISGDEGERRERRKSTGYRFFFDSNGQKLCVDASKESGRLGRLVNHGNKKEANSFMKHVDGHLFIFALRKYKPFAPQFSETDNTSLEVGG